MHNAKGFAQYRGFLMQQLEGLMKTVTRGIFWMASNT
jgi:hypothetical protein